jgi:branched-chain amino acid transport system ATP-binding protein
MTEAQTEAAGVRVAAAEPLLVVRNLDAYYGRAHVLQGVAFEMGSESLAIIGRNGMGKTTLCAAIMGIRPPEVRGSIRFKGRELCGRPSHKIGRTGIGYVPQGRRLFPSLTVDEHLKMVSGPGGRDGGRRWTPKDVYELFPRLGARRRNGGAQLSGGEQQMLAIGRALVTNPRLLIMDEPSEGLAPTIIEMLIETFKRLEQEGLSILLIEQNLGVATSLAERQLVMLAGRIAAETSAGEIIDDPDAQRRYLGVEPFAEQ